MSERQSDTTTTRRIRPGSATTPQPGPAGPGPEANGFGGHLAGLIADRMVPFTQLRFDAGASIYAGGQRPDDSVYLLTAGRAKTVMYSRSGRKCLLRIHSPGEVLGELAILGGERTETAIAMGPSVVRRVATSHLLRLMGAPAVHRHLIRHLGERLAEQQRAISHLVGDDSEHRLGVILLDLAERLGQPERDAARDTVRIVQRITQEELAGMVGTTRSRIGFFLRRFQECGAVEFSRGHVIRVHGQRLDAYLESRLDAC